MNRESGRGRSATPKQKRNHSDALYEHQMEAACRPTGAKRPDWMEDRSLLPKAPPSRPRLAT